MVDVVDQKLCADVLLAWRDFVLSSDSNVSICLLGSKSILTPFECRQGKIKDRNDDADNLKISIP
jgi:hypothetical protein